MSPHGFLFAINKNMINLVIYSFWKTVFVKFIII